MIIRRHARLRRIFHNIKLGEWQGFAMSPITPKTTGLPLQIWFGNYTLLNRPTIAIQNGARWINGAIWMTIGKRPKLRSFKHKRIVLPLSALSVIRQWVTEHRTALMDDWHYRTSTIDTLIALGLWQRKDDMGIEMIYHST